MTTLKHVALCARAWWYLLHHDCAATVLRGVRHAPARVARRRGASQDEVTRAVNVACLLYWKRVWCLQRAVVVSRLLRLNGVPAQVKVGFRPSPLLLHAWVDVDGRSVDASDTFVRDLTVLHVL
jgi:hypothetical protein